MSKIRVRVTMHRDDLVRYVDVDENEFPDSDTSTNKEFRELLKEELENEWYEVEPNIWVDSGGDGKISSKFQDIYDEHKKTEKHKTPSDEEIEGYLASM